MSTPLGNQSRLEQLERRLDQQDRILRGITGRRRREHLPRIRLARTVTAVYGEEYPTEDGANTFGLTFVDREFVPTQGIGETLDHDRSQEARAIGTTLNGQWVLEYDLVLAIPILPPPGTTGKGRWLIDPIKKHYWGKLRGNLARRGSAIADVWRIVGDDDLPAGKKWVDSGYTQLVWDRVLREDIVFDADTWVKFSWEMGLDVAGRWIVEVAGCEPDLELEYP